MENTSKIKEFVKSLSNDEINKTYKFGARSGCNGSFADVAPHFEEVMNERLDEFESGYKPKGGEDK
jgi:hypothetical protein